MLCVSLLCVRLSMYMTFHLSLNNRSLEEGRLILQLVILRLGQDK